MLEAKKSKIFESIFSVYNRNLLRRRFNSIKILGINNLHSESSDIPLIIFANHSSWWDGLIAFQISRTAQLSSFVMMEEKHLKKYLLFRKLGAFSILRESPREAVRSLEYAAKLLLENPSRSLWIFPQGQIQPSELRPLFFYNGISRIIGKLGKCRVVPIAFRYEFLNEFKPDVFIKVGRCELIESNSERFNSKETTKRLEIYLTETLDNLKYKILAGEFDNFQNII